jgi:hypothetical protein
MNPNANRLDMRVASHLPTWLAWPMLSTGVLVGMFVGTLYGEVISFYRTRHNGERRSK